MRIGAVRDLHIEKRPHPCGDSGEPAYQVTAVECGAVGVAHRLGYTRGTITGPWPLHTLLAWFARRSWLVPWEDIDTIRADHIILAVDRHQIQHLGQEQA
jgi:hypothetical protein